MEIVEVEGEEGAPEVVVAEETISLKCANCLSTAGCSESSDDPQAYLMECAIRRCCKDQKTGTYGTLPWSVKCDSQPDGMTVRDLSREINAAVSNFVRCPLYADCSVSGCQGDIIPYDSRCEMVQRGTFIIPLDAKHGFLISFVPEGPFVELTDLTMVFSAA